MADSIADRVVGCLKGIATGDAVGKQTETLSRDEIRRWYPGGIAGFEASISTHGGPLAIAAAAANAAAVSAAVDGASSDVVLALAEQAALRAEMRWSNNDVLPP